MSAEYILPVLYDLTLAIGNETRLRPLLTRFLQRLLYHTSFQAGLICLDLRSENPVERTLESRIGAVVGDYRLQKLEAQTIRLPSALLQGGSMHQENGGSLLASLGQENYHAFLRLPIEDRGVILLLAPSLPETEFPLSHMLQPVLAHLATALRFCQESETRTEALRNSHHLEAQRNLMASVYDSIPAGVVIADAAANIIAVNPAFTRITGYTAEEVLGNNPRLLSSGRQDSAFYQNLWDNIAKHNYWQGEIWNRRKNGEIYPEWLTITKVLHEQDDDFHYVAIFSDISEQKAAQQKIEFMARHDQLTGLPNRLLLQNHFDQAILQAERNAKQVALLFLDLDNFKFVNDVHGHFMGDRLLCLVADRLRALLRPSDFLSRLGGDEFVVVLTEITDASLVTDIAGMIMQAMREPFEVDKLSFHLAASIGISLYPSDAGDFDSLLKHADMAMYHSKSAGRDAFHFFTPAMNQLMRDRLEMEQQLHHALETGEFLLYYQPLIEFPDRRIVGAEALLRWSSPEMGMVAPSRFIPVAEECGLIVPIGEWVLREACRCAQSWQQQDRPEIMVAVNLSAVQFKRGDIVETVRNALAESGLPPHCLELELTESMLIQDTERTFEIVRQLKSLGLKLSLDDFGTGYSNMSYLKRLEVSKLKIDQSFVRGMTRGSESMAIVRAMIEMGRSLNLNIIAEGVETEEQTFLLQELGCQYGQGYLFCHPVPKQEFMTRLSLSSY